LNEMLSILLAFQNSENPPSSLTMYNSKPRATGHLPERHRIDTYSNGEDRRA